MDKRYRFDTFAPDSKNRGGFETIKELVNNGGQCVFVRGPSASGKTHLL